jgi:hypothetical protein
MLAARGKRVGGPGKDYKPIDCVEFVVGAVGRVVGLVNEGRKDVLDDLVLKGCEKCGVVVKSLPEELLE